MKQLFAGQHTGIAPSGWPMPPGGASKWSYLCWRGMIHVLDMPASGVSVST